MSVRALRTTVTTVTTVKRTVTRATRRSLALLTIALVLTACGSWRGIANVPLPSGPGTGGGMTIYVQMPDTLALNVNSRVRVADVEVGTVRRIELRDWTPVLTLALEPGIELPTNTIARIGQTSLLGSQHVELDPPDDPSQQMLRDGDTIPLDQAEAFPTTERVLASVGTILTGGVMPTLEVIQTEVYNIVSGRAPQIRDFLIKLDTSTAELNAQRDDLTRAIDNSNELLTIVANRESTLDRVLTEFPPLIEH